MVKLQEDYLQKYPDGLYMQKNAKARIEELSFNVATKDKHE